MAVSRNYYNLPLISTVIAILLFFLTFLIQESAAGVKVKAPSIVIKDEHQEKNKMILGSRPPGCLNKCLNCRPCKATLVIPPHKKTSQKGKFVISSSRNIGEDETYYLLSWKCKCANKLYKP
ncbi:hypothetical protein OROGR_014029 [Orobanche gracilis]